jgi:hypothetical protein
VEVSSLDAAQGGKTEVNGYILQAKGGPMSARPLARRSAARRQIQLLWGVTFYAVCLCIEV